MDNNLLANYDIKLNSTKENDDGTISLFFDCTPKRQPQWISINLTLSPDGSFSIDDGNIDKQNNNPTD